MPSVGYTREEMKDAVLAYQAIPRGSRMAWVEDQPFTYSQVKRWQRALFIGDLDRNLVPRDAGNMSQGEDPRIKELQRELALQKEQYERKLRAAEDERRKLTEGTAALGKAIGLLQQMREQEPGSRQDPTPEPAERNPEDS